MKEDKTDHLIQQLLDGTLDDAARIELNEMLRKSPEARESYRRAVTVHSALIQRGPGNIPSFIIREPSKPPAATKSRKFPYAIAALIALSASIAISDYLAVQKHQPRAQILSTHQAIWPAGFRASRSPPSIPMISR